MEEKDAGSTVLRCIWNICLQEHAETVKEFILHTNPDC